MGWWCACCVCVIMCRVDIHGPHASLVTMVTIPRNTLHCGGCSLATKMSLSIHVTIVTSSWKTPIDCTQEHSVRLTNKALAIALLTRKVSIKNMWTLRALINKIALVLTLDPCQNEINTCTVETGLLAHALLGSIAELYTLIIENAPIMQSFWAPPSNRMSPWRVLTRKLARKWASKESRQP